MLVRGSSGSSENRRPTCAWRLHQSELASTLTDQYGKLRYVFETQCWEMLSKKRTNKHHSAEPAAREVSMKKANDQCEGRAVRCCPRRKPTTTSAQSLLGEMSMEKANNHNQCRECLELLSKQRANNHQSAEPAGRHAHEECQQPIPMQSMPGYVVKEESQQPPQRRACWEACP